MADLIVILKVVDGVEPEDALKEIEAALENIQDSCVKTLKVASIRDLL